MAEESLRALLRSTEDLGVVLKAQVIQPTSLDSKTDVGVGNTTLAYDSRDARLLAVIVHQDDTRYASKEGSIFVCTFKAQDDANQAIEVESVFPLTSDFSIYLTQTKPSVSGLNIHNLDENDTDVCQKTTRQRNLILIFYGCYPTPCIANHLIYVSHTEKEMTKRLTSSLVKIPQDLRSINEPLHTRLSASLAGSLGDDIADLKLIRNESINIRAREVSTKGQYTLKIRIGTFNVNGRLPSQDLSSWVLNQTSAMSSVNATLVSVSNSVSPTAVGGLEKGLSSKSLTSEVDSPREHTPDIMDQMIELVDPDPELLVLGFQELDLSTEALVYSLGTAREDAWCHAIFAGLGEKMELYEKLTSKQHVGMFIVVIVKKALISCFSNIHSSVASTGIMGIMGNKGSVAVRLTFTPPISHFDVSSPGPTTVAFINSHFAAFDGNADKRNSDFHEVSKKLKFESGSLDAASTVPVHVSAYESDVLFWMVN
ncbi:hypothetical protein C0993_007530 [Termitomyces sp. T159_Od127]|nr:hypothetical protein C0993_007530 [Termitomyces sp. T159_Od127]